MLGGVFNPIQNGGVGVGGVGGVEERGAGGEKRPSYQFFPCNL